MCLIGFAWNTVPDHPLVMLANRDEFHDRPAAPLAVWADHPDIVAGRDLREHGTWLGLSRRGRLAAVTNVRGADAAAPRPRSRGALVTDFLVGAAAAMEHAEGLRETAREYGGYNLLLWDGNDLVYASNRPDFSTRRVAPGIHALSNAQLDTPWPKTGRVRQAMQAWIASGLRDESAALAAMGDPLPAADGELPDTGVGLELERGLSSPFIWMPGYGTRCTSLLRVGASGEAQLLERRYNASGQADGDNREVLQLVMR
jgi:uncharacterized protein with NRDE domain